MSSATVLREAAQSMRKEKPTFIDATELDAAALAIDVLRLALQEVLDGVDCQPGYIRESGIRIAKNALNQTQ